MLLVFLIVLLAGTAWSLPLLFDVIMIDVAQADIDVQLFSNVLENGEFDLLPNYYAKLAAHQSTLRGDQNRMKDIEIPKSARSAQDLLTIQLDKLIFKLRGILPKNAESSTTYVYGSK